MMERNDVYLYDNTFLTQETLKNVADSLPTPFYLYDEHGIRQNVRKIKKAFAWSDGHRQHFIMRFASNPAILKIMREEGSGVQCCTLWELELAAQCGFSDEEILYAPMFPQDDAYARMRELKAVFLIDSMAVAGYCLERGDVPQTVALRYNPGGKFVAGHRAVARPDRSPLGMTREEILEAAPLLLRAGVKRLGLEVCLVKQSLETDLYASVGQLLLELARALAQVDVPVAFCDLGGGIGLGFLPETDNADPLVIGERARLLTEDARRELQAPFWTAAGRSMVGPCGIFVSRVLCTKKTVRDYIVLDASVTQFPRAMQGAYHHISVVGKTEKSGRMYYDVVGCLPDIASRFAERRMLPQVQPGDYCVIHNAGFSAGSMQMEYGGVPVCAEYLYTEDGAVAQIRRAGTMQDYFRAW